MRAVLIDDDRDFMSLFKMKWEEITNKLDFPIELVCECNHEAILMSDSNYDTYFMDIEMPEKSGIDLAFELQQRYGVKEVIFVSSHNQYIKRSMFVKPRAFICKGNLDEDLSETLIFLKKLWEENHKEVVLMDNRKEISLSPSKIMYCKSDGHYIDIYMCNDNRVIIRSKMVKMDEALSKYNFLRIHSRYIVNLKYVKDFKRDIVLLTNGEKLEISRSYYQDVAKKMLKWFDSINTPK